MSQPPQPSSLHTDYVPVVTKKLDGSAFRLDMERRTNQIDIGRVLGVARLLIAWGTTFVFIAFGAAWLADLESMATRWVPARLPQQHKRQSHNNGWQDGPQKQF